MRWGWLNKTWEFLNKGFGEIEPDKLTSISDISKSLCRHSWERQTVSFYIPCADGEFMPPLEGEYSINSCLKCGKEERI